ncbi:MAG TPA: PAS domain S-box protein, partial [Verrucomicrobiae bacterium]|nr:PAS domain S-box protein [Verrucomicrobiae bacterium]
MAGVKGEQKQSLETPTIPVFPSIMLAAGVLISAWCCVSEARQGLGIFTILNLVAPIIIGGGACHLAMATVMRRRTLEIAERFRAAEDEAKRIQTNLQVQLLEARKEQQHAETQENKTKEELEQTRRARDMVKAELDQLKQAEKNLSRRRQELESSKTVLELHVQERQMELRKLQRRYELILNSAGEGICGLDLEGKASFVNPAVARITGWTVAELVGKTEAEIFGQNHAAGNGNDAQKAFGERLFYRKDGTCLPVEYVRTPINENGNLIGSVLVFKDITERKRVEAAIEQKAAELSRSNAELEQFAFVASHDLQEPLRKILAFGDRLKTRLEGALAPESKEYLDRMQNAAARMRTLIDDLLTFSRVIRRSEPFAKV